MDPSNADMRKDPCDTAVMLQQSMIQRSGEAQQLQDIFSGPSPDNRYDVETEPYTGTLLDNYNFLVCPVWNMHAPILATSVGIVILWIFFKSSHDTWNLKLAKILIDHFALSLYG